MKKQKKLNCKTGNLKYIIFMFSLFVISLPIKAKDFVIISEIMYDTPLNEQIATGVAYSNGEYVELYNAGIEAVSLNGWSLRGGGVTETYYFATGTVLAPKSYIIVAYQYNNSNFTLDQLYSGVVATSEHQIQYHHKILLSNSGEPVYLRNNAGITKDSIYYDGTSNKTKPNRLSAENADGLSGNSCVSIQRRAVLFDTNGNCISNNTDWITATVSPFQQNSAYIAPYLPGIGIGYSYDMAGNRTSRNLVTLTNGASYAKGNTSGQESIPVEEQLGNHTITVYPNPTKGELAINIKGVTQNPIEAGDDAIRFILYSAQGVLLQTKYAEPGITTLDMVAYPSGWYILRILDGGKFTELKIVKQ